MKRTIASRILASAIAVVLAVGLMPLPAFAEADDSEAQQASTLTATALSYVKVPYVLESDDGANPVNRYSIIATSATWTGDGWDEQVNPTGYFMIGQYSTDPQVVSLPERYEDPNTNLYLIAEHVSEGNATDYASDPVLIPNIKKEISVTARDTEYEYDGKYHGTWCCSPSSGGRRKSSAGKPRSETPVPGTGVIATTYCL